MRNTNSGISKTENTHAKSIFSYNVYRTNHQQRTHVRSNHLKSSSLLSAMEPDSQVLYMNEKMFKKKPTTTKTSKLIKECSTQTSKTILQLAQNENGPHADAQNQTSELSVLPPVQEQKVVEPANKANTPRYIPGEQSLRMSNLMGSSFKANPSQNIHRLPANYSLPVANCNQSQNSVGCEQSQYISVPASPPVVPVPQNVSQVMPRKKSIQIPISTLSAQNSRSVSPVRIGLQIEFIGEGMNKNINHEEVEDVSASPPIETNQMTPDSLQQSPRDYYNNMSMENCPYSVASRLSNFTLDGSCTEQDCDFNSSKPNGNFPDKTLTQAFLKKSLSRTHERREGLKSKSFITTFEHPNYIQDSAEYTEVIHSKQRAVKKSSRSLDLPDNSFMRTTRRSSGRFGGSSFMWPTTATQIKSIMAEIQSANSLIPRIRRGKSTSPKPTADKRRFESSRKIPYIDQSKSDVSSSTTLINASRHPELIRLKELDGDNSKSECSNRFSDEVLSVPISAEHSSSSFNDNTISNALTKLQELDWRLALRGLGEIVEICRVVDVDLIYGYMSAINQRLIDLLKSPRSHVCRTACQAAGHLFEYVKDTARPLFEEIVDLLLNKTADANKFIRHDANMALDCMVTHIPTYNAIRALCNKGPFHKNPLVRCATARLLVCAIVIGGVDFILNPINNECTRKRIILTMARLLEDYKSLETRKLAERIYKVLSKDGRFDVYLKKYLEKEQILKIKQTLRIIRKK